ncbi:9820_t:CDS:2, partial [Racocetra persica]
KEYTYAQFPTKFVFDKHSKKWKLRICGNAIGRIYFVYPNAEGDIENRALNLLNDILKQQGKTLEKFPNMPVQSEFAGWLLKLGEGRLSEVVYNNSIISLPSDMVLRNNNMPQKLIDFVYAEIQNRFQNATYLIERAILASQNDDIDMLNSEVLARFP